MALLVKMKQPDGSVGDVYLRDRDIKTLGFGIEQIKNPIYDKDVVDSDELVDKEVLKEIIHLDYCKITLYDTIEQEVPYESVKRVNGKDTVVVKTRKELVNNYWAEFDKDRLVALREYAEKMD